jgi:hypothetical protein
MVKNKKRDVIISRRHRAKTDSAIGKSLQKKSPQAIEAIINHSITKLKVKQWHY